jgi:hypothetical protein
LRVYLSFARSTETGRECRDSLDNDGDGAADCADPDCAATQACSCASPPCARPTGGTGGRPGGAGGAGGAPAGPDPTCFTAAAPAFTLTRCCNSALGPDGDVSCWGGGYDFARCCPDPNAPAGGRGGGAPDDPGTESGRECRDTLDNDGDGSADCADPDCAESFACNQELVDSGSLRAFGRSHPYETWMEDNWSQLSGMTLLHVTLPGSHNSGNTIEELGTPGSPKCESDNKYSHYLSHRAPVTPALSADSFDAGEKMPFFSPAS